MSQGINCIWICNCQKIILRLKEISTWQENAWSTDKFKLLDNSSVTNVNSKHDIVCSAFVIFIMIFDIKYAHNTQYKFCQNTEASVFLFSEVDS